MREIISLQVGQCGNQIGAKFWESISAEHGLDGNGQFRGTRDGQRDGLNVYFNEVDNGKYVPRSVLVDLEPGVLNNIKEGACSDLFRPANYLCNQNSAGNNWAKGFYTEGADMIENILEVVRKEIEQCDKLQGFQICHSIGGGTGSGLGTLLLSKIKEEYPDPMLYTYSVLPSPRVSNVVVEPYNAMLSLHQLIDNADGVVCFDNEALHDICSNTLKQKVPSYSNLNTLIAQTMCGFTSSLRFPGQLNTDLRKTSVNLVPFPRLHFFLSSLAPLGTAQQSSFRNHSVGELMQQLFDAKNMMVACDPRHGRYLTASVQFRGSVSTQEVDDQLFSLQSKYHNCFADWIPTSIKSSISEVAPAETKVSATLLANNTAIQETFARVSDNFKVMFRKKAFLYNYLSEGMQEEEFFEAESNVADLMTEYQQYQEASALGEEN